MSKYYSENYEGKFTIHFTPHSTKKLR